MEWYKFSISVLVAVIGLACGLLYIEYRYAQEMKLNVEVLQRTVEWQKQHCMELTR